MPFQQTLDTFFENLVLDVNFALGPSIAWLFAYVMIFCAAIAAGAVSTDRTTWVRRAAIAVGIGVAAACVAEFAVVGETNNWLHWGFAVVLSAGLGVGFAYAGAGGMLAMSRGLDAIVVALGKFGAWIMVPLVLVILIDIILVRKLGVELPFFTSTKLQELEWHLHTVIFALGFGFAYIANAHVRVDLVREKLKPRRQQWIEVVGCVMLMVPYCGLVLMVTVEFAARSYDQGEVSPAMTGLSHRWIIKAFLPAGFLIATLSALAVLTRRLITLFAPADIVAATERHEAREIVAMSKSD